MFRPAWVAAVVALLFSFASPLTHAAITDQAIFVAKSGSDANAGTQALPKLTIAAGIAAAQAGAIPNVVVSKGTYAEQLNLPSGISLFGGYDAAAGWTRSPANTTTIQAAGVVIVVSGYAATGQIEGFTIQAMQGGPQGTSTYGIFLKNTTGLRISRNVIVAASGNPGAPGTNAPVGPGKAPNGLTGGNGCAGTGCGIGGAGGLGSCNTGGKGGNGGFNNSIGQAGSAGSGGTSGGASGTASGQCGSQSGNGGLAGNGFVGNQGTPGSGGVGSSATVFGWFSAVGGDGGSGSDGASGPGGGGGGGGSNLLAGFPSCTSDTGGGGGGGGAGGCGGSAGQGGNGGGGSFGIFAAGTLSVQIIENEIQAGNGANGGKGGNGASGQLGGDGGIQGAASDDSGAGGHGGNGGNGGAGGPGGGGVGGPSYGIYTAVAGVAAAQNTITVGNPGLGGSGGTNPSGGVGGTGQNGNTAASAGTTGATPFTLTVAKAGAGSGTVISDAGWIACGATCSEIYGSGIVVALSATASAGSVFTGWSGDCTGTGACSVTMSAARNVTATFTDPPRLANISTRMQVLTGSDVMIGGFVIGGATTKRVAIVATGPSLTQYGIANALANPTLSLVRSSDQSTVATSDDWQTDANAAQLTAAGFAPSNTLESGLLVDLAPGAYTAIVQGAAAGTGVAVIGVYEVDHPETPLTNISTRGRVLTGSDVMIGGFIINGSGPQTVAIVATGPSLAQYGIASPLANPTISLVRSSDQTVIATNDDWQTDANAALLTSAGFAPSDPLESALYTTLPPGAYTVIVQGVGGGTGVAVIGVYKVN